MTPVGTIAALGVTAAGIAGAASLASLNFSPSPQVRHDTPAQRRQISRALANLRVRLDRLENSAPFEVVDSEAHPIVTVTPGSVVVYNTNHTPVATIYATAEGGWFTGHSADGMLEASFGVSGTHAGLWASEDRVERASVGRRPRGNYALEIRSRSEAVAAAIGESYAGNGAILVNDGEGRVRASFQIGDAGPMIAVSSRGGAPVLALTQSAAGAGMFAIGDVNGEPMVKMDVNGNRYGAVLAGPVAGLPLVTGSGLPGSYFLGCAGGDACRQ